MVTSRAQRPGLAAPLAALVVAMVSVQYGATSAKLLFPAVGALGATTLRLGLGALILLPILRPWRATISRRNLPALLGYGASVGVMNLLFYLALARIPLGIAVALEFTGPLSLALAHSRKAIHFVWIALAVAGLLVLLPIGHTAHAPDLLGVVFALAAGAAWALYTVFGQSAGADHGAQTASLGILIGALLVCPFGLAHGGAALWTAPVLRLALVVAIFSSALPFTMEIIALTRMPTRVYGTLTSAEPALGALMGAIFLHEHLTGLQAAAIAAIMLASIGTAAGMQAAPLPN